MLHVENIVRSNLSNKTYGPFAMHVNPHILQEKLISSNEIIKYMGASISEIKSFYTRTAQCSKTFDVFGVQSEGPNYKGLLYITLSRISPKGCFHDLNQLYQFRHTEDEERHMMFNVSRNNINVYFVYYCAVYIM